MEPSSSADNVFLLACDIGGTNSRFRIIERSLTTDHRREIDTYKYPNKDYNSIVEVFEKLFEDKTEEVKVCALAIAGANVDRKVRVTNIPHWPEVDAEQLKEQFHFDKLYLLNDFEANGYGAANLDTSNSEKCVCLNTGRKIENAPMVIVGPGTGLGAAIMTYNTTEGNYNVHPGEGGHIEWPVTTEEELRLRQYALNWFRERENLELKRLSTERVTAGPALPLLFGFFRQEYPDLESSLIEKFDNNTIEPNDILEGMRNGDPICQKVVHQFVRNLAVITGDLAMITLCYGGIFLCGGVGQALREHFTDEECHFKSTISNKGRMSQRISEIPIHLITGEIGLEGSEHFAYQAVKHNYEES